MNGDQREPAARNLPEFFQSVASTAAEATIHLSDGDERAYFSRTMGFDLDKRRVLEREHLGRGPVGLAPMSLQPLVASTSLDRLDWKQDDERWMAGLDLLDYDRESSRRDDPLSRELLALLVRITADSRTMIEEAPNPAWTDHTQDTARRLRAVTDRLHTIVHALTAVHTFGSAESSWSAHEEPAFRLLPIRPRTSQMGRGAQTARRSAGMRGEGGDDDASPTRSA